MSTRSCPPTTGKAVGTDNAESVEQTVRDMPKGAPHPLGRRGAVKADSLLPARPGHGLLA